MLPTRNLLNAGNYNIYSSSINQPSKTRDLVYNSSANHDRYIHTHKIFPDTTPRLNYAPFRKQLQDSIGTYSQHPTARYVDASIPFYSGLFYTDTPLNEITAKKNAEIEAKLNLDRTKTTRENAKKFNDTYTTQTTIKVEVPTLPQQRQMNASFIDNMMFKYSNLKNEMKNTTYGDGNGPSDVYRNIGTTVSAVETFTPGKKEAETTVIDESYLHALEAKIIGVLHYLKSDRHFDHWSRNWDLMEKCLKKDGFKFNRLEESDVDIAYVVNKGEHKRFRIRADNYKYIPLNVSQYVLYHECAHLANPIYGHGKEFCELLSLICLAAFQCGQINIEKLSKSLYMTHNQPIVCQGDMKSEIIRGIDAVLKYNSDEESVDYYESLRRFIMAKN